MSMKRVLILLGFALFSVLMFAQNKFYLSVKDVYIHRGDSLSKVVLEKRTKNQLMLTPGGDYKISASSPSTCKRIKGRYFAIEIDGNLYLNCRKLRFNRFRFGTCYAPAMWVKDKIYFSALPIGSAAASITSATNYNMGDVGRAIASSSLLTERVYYFIDPITYKVEFVSRDVMSELLIDQPDLRAEYLSSHLELASVTGKYLKILAGVDQ